MIKVHCGQYQVYNADLKNLAFFMSSFENIEVKDYSMSESYDIFLLLYSTAFEHYFLLFTFNKKMPQKVTKKPNFQYIFWLPYKIKAFENRSVYRLP